MLKKIRSGNKNLLEIYLMIRIDQLLENINIKFNKRCQISKDKYMIDRLI